jgi:hypothetical protein
MKGISLKPSSCVYLNRHLDKVKQYVIKTNLQSRYCIRLTAVLWYKTGTLLRPCHIRAKRDLLIP